MWTRAITEHAPSRALWSRRTLGAGCRGRDAFASSSAELLLRKADIATVSSRIGDAGDRVVAVAVAIAVAIALGAPVVGQ